jgi:hypothetical protein
MLSASWSIRIRRALLVLMLCTLAGGRLRAQVVINEVLASNRLTATDEDGDSSDWVELLNVGSADAALKGYGLSDDPSEPLRWLLPDVTLPPTGRLLVWLSGKDRLAPPPEAIVAANSTVPFVPSLILPDADGTT